MTCTACRARDNRHLRNCPVYLAKVKHTSIERERTMRLFGLVPNQGEKR